jgi:hypothetical protein
MTGLRILLILPVVALVAVVPAAILAWVDGYALHFCRWPATISCDEPGGRWFLVPAWYAVFGLVGSVALGAWAWTGRNGRWPWLLAVWSVVFLPLTVASGPRMFMLADLVLFGGYSWLGLELTRRTVLAWQPRLRVPANLAALCVSIGYVVVLATMPTYLAARAI